MQAAPTQSQTLMALRTFLLSVVPAGVEVLAGQANRVAEPASPDFFLMTPLSLVRLATNEHASSDCTFLGTITGSTLTASGVLLGPIVLGATVYGSGVASGTTIIGFGTGNGSDGTYTISQSQTVASTMMASGFAFIVQRAQLTYQLDAHGPGSTDNIQVVHTMFRDDYAVQSFANSGYAVTPLYCGDPHQTAFINGEQQYEDRWTLDVTMEALITIEITQQYADQISAGLISVDAEYHA